VKVARPSRSISTVAFGPLIRPDRLARNSLRQGEFLAGRDGFEPPYRGPESSSRASVCFRTLCFGPFRSRCLRSASVHFGALSCSVSHCVSCAVAAFRFIHPSSVVDARYNSDADAIELKFSGGGSMSIPRRIVPGLERAAESTIESIVVSPAGDALSWPSLESMSTFLGW
jgi:hypothetical protein